MAGHPHRTTRAARLWNFISRIGVIAGARWFVAGRNTSATITPVVAINMVY